ncbi:MAG: 16S rRNA (adenine(1518)-N(6)/adenine(1519)-N(6))-dimethyltransferase RsmA [Alicyclobacillaceae bacterium]|nr:16S rRNA (adenine(1518)-N(6)/adenine(1519)-N(6))-dimethyltransferase RsmA [Alicyclobacillaceae bacterium]
MAPHRLEAHQPDPFRLAQPRQLKEVLARHGFTLKHGLGQHFLVDAGVLRDIVEAAGIGSEDGAFEVGPGAGVLTACLGHVARRVLAVEKDPALRPVLAETLDGLHNVEVRFADVLDLDLRDLWAAFADCRRVAVVANLPYYVTTPILFRLLEAGVRMDVIVLMVQREVAERLAAHPGSKSYGALSVAVQYRAEVQRLRRVGPGCFLPPPDVESAVVRLRLRSQPAVEVDDDARLFQVVRAAFGTRRKTLRNALRAGLGLSGDECEALLAEAGIDASRRGETLSLEEFAAIANTWGRMRPRDPGAST